MNSIEIWLRIIIPIILILIFISIIIYLSFLILQNNNKNKTKTGFFSVEIDLKQNRMRLNNFYWNSIINSINNEHIQNIFNSGWINITNVFNKLGPNESKKWKRAIEFCINNQADTSVKTEIITNEITKTIWLVKFIYLNSNEIRINIDWTTKVNNDKFEIISSEKDIISLEGEYKLFVSFNFIKFNLSSIQEFSTRLKKFLKLIDPKITIYKNVLILIIGANNFKELDRKRRKIIKLFNKNNKYFQNFYNSSTFVEAKQIQSKSDWIKTLIRILFGLTKSEIIKETFFFDLKIDYLNEFQEFKKSFFNIEDMIGKGNIDILLKPIKNIYNNHKVIDFVIPNYSIESNYWNEDVMNICNFNNKIIDLTFLKIMNSSFKNSLVINVNDYFIHDNFELMKKNNKIIYIINFIEYSDENKIIDLLTMLKKYNIKFGFKIDEFNPILASIINNTQPNIIFINKKFTNEFNSKDNIDLLMNKLTLLSLCEKWKISPVFINPLNNKEEILAMGNVDKLYCEY